jgi:hypothetical protein
MPALADYVLAAGGLWTCLMSPLAGRRTALWLGALGLTAIFAAALDLVTSHA